ncbi:hypothetical protein PIB30_035035 [Stylosanthes scabra]|uniref:Secreted protein n=1 Tax=Stylosanthes scabra TaxID=79078 RepID=A0ABU6WCN8_9FABA|nr:hypothetical protein [Stylosanthes scabra]
MVRSNVNLVAILVRMQCNCYILQEYGVKFGLCVRFRWWLLARNIRILMAIFMKNKVAGYHQDIFWQRSSCCVSWSLRNCLFSL